MSFFVIQGINLDVKLVIGFVHKGHLCVRKVSMKYFIGLLLWDDQSSKNTYKLWLLVIKSMLKSIIKARRKFLLFQHKTHLNLLHKFVTVQTCSTILILTQNLFLFSFYVVFIILQMDVAALALNFPFLFIILRLKIDYYFSNFISFSISN